MLLCSPGATIKIITQRVEKIMVPGKGGSVLVHIGSNNAEREDTTATTQAVDRNT